MPTPSKSAGRHLRLRKMTARRGPGQVQEEARSAKSGGRGRLASMTTFEAGPPASPHLGAVAVAELARSALPGPKRLLERTASDLELGKNRNSTLVLLGEKSRKKIMRRSPRLLAREQMKQLPTQTITTTTTTRCSHIYNRQAKNSLPNSRTTSNLIGAQQQAKHRTEMLQSMGRANVVSSRGANSYVTRLRSVEGAQGGTGASDTGRQQQQQQHQQQAAEDAMRSIRMKSASFPMKWSEDMKGRYCILSEDRQCVCINPYGSRGGSACLASQPLPRNGNYYYWEIKVFERVYGTSVMFGLCTKNQQLEVNSFYNLIGLDSQGWCLSHKGLVWHAGSSRPYTRPFRGDGPTLVGLLFDSFTGQLSFFKDGENLGVAFFGLNEINEDLYPCVGSTAKRTAMKIVGAYFGPETLMQRVSSKILQHSSDHSQLLSYLEKQYGLPQKLLNLLKLEAASRSGTTLSGSQSNEASASSSSLTQSQANDEESPFANIHQDLLEPLYLQYMGEIHHQYY